MFHVEHFLNNMHRSGTWRAAVQPAIPAGMDSLPIFVRLRGQPVVLLGDGPAAAAKARLIDSAGGVVVRGPGPGVRLAFVALDDAARAADAAAVLRAAGCLVNVVDRPALCDFTVPAIVDRSPVVVAVGTGGASATLAKALRERFEALLPARLGDLAQAVRAARQAVAAVHPTPEARRRFWDAQMAPGARLDPLGDPNPQNVAAALYGPPSAPEGLTEIVLISPDPDDLTLRQLRALAQADVVVFDAQVPPAVLDRARRDAARLPVTAAPHELPGRVVRLRMAAVA